MSLGHRGRVLAIIVAVVWEGVGCSNSDSTGNPSAPATDGASGQTADQCGADGSSIWTCPDSSYLARLDTGYFKQNCTMGFDISGKVFSEYADTLEKELAFQGDILGAPDFTAASGFFTVKITSGGAAYGASFPAGTYTVVKWFDFTGGTVAYRIANKAAGIDGGTADSVRATQAQAESDFTDVNGYFTKFCCPYANHYPDLRLVGTFRATAGNKGLIVGQVPDPTSPGKTLFQITAYDDLTTGAVFLQGIIGRTNDLAAPYGYWRVLVTSPGSSGFAVNQYTVVAWQRWDGRRVEVAFAQKPGFPSTVASQGDALLVFTVGAGYFSFDTAYDKQY